MGGSNLERPTSDKLRPLQLPGTIKTARAETIDNCQTVRITAKIVIIKRFERNKFF